MAATRPIPFGFPVDLAISDDGQYLYVSYQGLPTATGSGGVLVFDAKALVAQVQSSLAAQPSGSLLRTVAIDDLPLNNSNQRQENPLIDVRADYLFHLENGDQVFGTPAGHADGPVATGGYPGGIAVEHSPTPQLTVYKRVADEEVGNKNLLPGVNLIVATDLSIPATRVDELDGNVVTENGDFIFAVDIASKVTLTIDGKVATNVGNALDPSNTIAAFKDVVLQPGIYHYLINPVESLDPALKTHTYVLTATAYNPNAAFAASTPKVGVAAGKLTNELDIDQALPVGHTIVDGVDIWDGHLVVSGPDVTLPGRGLSLEFNRIYTSQGDSSEGPLGAGWTDSYNVKLVEDDKGFLTVVGGDSTGNTFNPNGHTDPTLAAQFGVPDELAATALFFDPQVGFHSVLVQSDASKAAFDFFTPAHVRYHFELEAGLQPYNKVFTLRSITDPNGNRISLYYSKDQPLDPHFGLSADLQSKLDDDSTTLDVVEDSAGRAFVFTYQMIFGEKRLVELKGYDPDSPTHDLLGLDIKYNYDDGYGNLTSVTRVGTLPDGSDARTDIYTYTPGDDRLSHNMLTHTVPGNGSGISTLTTTYDYYSQTSDTAGALPTEGTDPRINQYFQSLNLEGERIQAVHMPGGETGSSDESVTTFQYDFSGKTRTVSDPRSGVPATIYTLNAYGATVKIEAPEGRTTTMVWATPQTPHPEAFADGAGKGGKDIELVSITDADGQTTSYKYDNLGNAIEITTTFPNGRRRGCRGRHSGGDGRCRKSGVPNRH